jgi:RHS repeat-associated protein
LASRSVKTYDYFLDKTLKQTTYTNAVVATPTVSFTYDPVYSRVASMTDGTGTTSYSYNPVLSPPQLGAGALASVDGPLANDTVSYSYDELGRIVSRGLSGFASTFAYDALSRVTGQGSPVGNFSFTYDGTTTRPLTTTYPNNQVTQYAYFPNSGDRRLQEIKYLAPGGAVISKYDYTYDVVGNIASWTQLVGAGPAKVYTPGYDAADQLATAKVTGPTPLPVPSRFAYTYDPAGNRTAEQLDDAVTGATFNNRNQLTSRQPGGALLFRGTVNEPATVTVGGKPAPVASDNSFAGQAPVPSGASNVVVTATDPSGNTRTNTYQVSESGSATSYTYDANGNLTSDGTKTYEWDAENRLTRVTQGGSELARFVYDGKGRRAQKIAGGVTHSYVYDKTNIIEERLSSGQTYDYVQGPGIDRPLAQRDQAGVVTYYLADHLGSIVQTTNSAGTVTLTRDYDPWGNPIQGSSVGGYAFTGREWDPETSLYYYRARYYDPKIGRFISEDPIGFDEGDTNLYGYVRNSPSNLVDPSGLTWKDDTVWFWEWVFGGGPDARYLGPNTPQTRDMMNAYGVNKARQLYCQKNKNRRGKPPLPVRNAGKGSFPYPMGPMRAGMNSTQQYVGTYSVDMYPNPDGTVNIVLNNTTSMGSFLYGIPVDWERSSFPFFGNQHQTYYWTESCNCQ